MKTHQKIAAYLFAATVVMALSFLLGTPPVDAGESANNTISWKHYVDSTGAKVDSTKKASMPVFYPQQYGSLRGNFSLWYVTVDTGTAGTRPDTTKDTIVVLLKTSMSNGYGMDTLASWRINPAGSAAMKSEATATWYNFNVSDSGLKEKVWFDVRSLLLDSTNTKARLSAGSTYKMRLYLFGWGE